MGFWKMDKSNAELAAMRARGELTTEEFFEAKRLLGETAAAARKSEARIPQNPFISNTGKVTRTGKVFVAIIAVMIVGMLILPSARDKEQEEIDQVNGFHCLSVYDGSYEPLAKAVQENLRDPSSFEHVKTGITPKDKRGFHHVEMIYRANNGFGGKNVEVATALIRNSDCATMNAAINGQPFYGMLNAKP